MTALSGCHAFVGSGCPFRHAGVAQRKGLEVNRLEAEGTGFLACTGTIASKRIRCFLTRSRFLRVADCSLVPSRKFDLLEPRAVAACFFANACMSTVFEEFA
jgi:hypothetical protein